MKKLLVLVMASIMMLSLFGCGSASGTSDLTGTWQSENKDGSYHEANISGDTIEIYWVSDNGDSKSLYWAGSYTAPSEPVTEYSWTSTNDKEKTEMAILASGDDTKDFTYSNGVISYSASAMGTTTTMKLEKK